MCISIFYLNSTIVIYRDMVYKPRIVLHGMSSKYARTEERVRKKAIHIYNSTTTGSRCPGRFGKKKRTGNHNLYEN